MFDNGFFHIRFGDIGDIWFVTNLFAIQSVMDRYLEIVPVREELDVVFAVVKENVGVVGEFLQSRAAALHKLHMGENIREDGLAVPDCLSPTAQR